jgi:hypothetical protein
MIRLIDMFAMTVFSTILCGVFYDVGHHGVSAAFGVISALLIMASMIRYLNRGA